MALLSKEYVSTITAQHIRLLSRETTELYLNGVNLTRDALQELQKLPIELLSLNSASGLQPHDEPIVLPVPCARWRSSAMRCRRKHCWPRRDGIRDCCRYGMARQRERRGRHRTGTILLPQDHRSCIERRDRERRERADRHAELTALDLSSNLIGSNGSTQLTASRMPASSRLSRWTSATIPTCRRPASRRCTVCRCRP